MASRPAEFPMTETSPGDRAVNFFRAKLTFETDPADVQDELSRGGSSIVVVDARSRLAYAAGHVPGAINLPHREMNAETVKQLDRDKTYVVYCDGIGCNASTKGSLNLSLLGFRVKEMMGGIDWWRRDGFPVHTLNDQPVDPSTSAPRCDC